MNEVKRYVTTCDCMSEASWGDYVRHADYDALAAECERLRAESANIRARWTEYGREVEAQRDTALAELAALKGGREVVACACGSVDHSVGYESPQAYWVECGDCGYATERAGDRSQAIAAWNSRNSAPPAQASAWVPISEQLPPKTGPYLAYGPHSILPPLVSQWFSDCEAWEHEWLRKKKSEVKPKTWITHWMHLPAAPTPGASE